MSNEIKFTPEYAKTILALVDHDKNKSIQRKVDRVYVAHLARQMKQGKFGRNEIQLYRFGGDAYLVNGQHTLNAIIESGVALILPMFERTVFDLEEVKAAYARADVGKRRTMPQLLKAFGLTEQTGIPAGQLNKVRSAIKYIAENMSKFTGHQARMVSPAEWVEAALVGADYFKEIELDCLADNYNIVVKKALLRRVELAHVILTYAQHPKASEFWQGVASGEMMKSTDPRKKLHDFLMISKVSGGAALGKTVTQEEVADTIAYCWNKYLDGKAISQMRVISGGTLSEIDAHEFCLDIPFYKRILNGRVKSVYRTATEEEVVNRWQKGQKVGTIATAVYGASAGNDYNKVKQVLEKSGIEHGLSPATW